MIAPRRPPTLLLAALGCVSSPAFAQGAGSGWQSNTCAATSYVTRQTPDACAAEHNSPVEAEVRFVPRIGFVDGTSCAIWPSREMSAWFGQLTGGVSGRTAADAQWFSQQVGILGLSDWVVFGTKRELVVRTVPWPRTAGGPSMTVAVDLATGYGTALDPDYTCSEGDVQQGRCSVIEGHIEGATVRVLVRDTPAQLTRRNVMLAADRIRFVDDPDMQVNLALFARKVTGELSRSAHINMGPNGILVQNTSADREIGSSWQQIREALTAVAYRPIFATFADEVEGIDTFCAQTRAPVRYLRLSSPSGGALIRTQQVSQATRTVELSFARAVPHEIAWSLTQSKLPNGDVDIVHHASLQFAAPPAVRGPGTGGVAQLGVTRTGGYHPDLEAPGEPAVDALWSVPELREYTDAVSAEINAPESLGCSTELTGGKTCDYRWVCDYTSPSKYACGWQRVCEPETRQVCHRLGQVLVDFAHTSPAAVSGLSEVQFSDYLTNRLNMGLHLAYPPPAGTPPNGETRYRISFSRTNFARHAIAHGAYFRVAYDAADNLSRRHGLPAMTWAELGQASSPDILLPPFNPANYGIVEAELQTVRRRQAYLEGLDPTLDVRLNAIDMPFGRWAASWHPTTITDDPSHPTSMLELADRWSDISQMARELDEAADDADLLQLVDDLMSVTDAQLVTTMEAASSLSAAAERNTADQLAAIARLESVSAALQDVVVDFESGMVTTWNCQGGFANCPAAIGGFATQIQTECEDNDNLGPFADLINGLSSALGVLVPALSAVNTVVSSPQLVAFLQQSAAVTQGATPNTPQLLSGLQWLASKKDDVASLRGKLKSVRKGAAKIVEALDLAAPDCSHPGLHADLVQLQSELVTVVAIAGVLETQAGLLDGVISALSANLTQAIAARHAYDHQATQSQALLDELDYIRGLAQGSFDRQRRFVEAACKTTQLSIQGAQADYKALSDTLSTLAGRSSTSPLLYVPRSPAGGASSTARRDGYALSVWDSDLFSAFTLGGAAVNSTFIDAAEARFGEFLGQVCAPMGGALSNLRWVVRKRLTGAELADFTSTGRVSFDVTLADVLEGSASSGALFDAVSASAASGAQYPLSGPVLLGAGYSLCTGPASEPCCTGPGCRMSAMQDNLQLVHRVGYVPTLACSADTAEVSEDRPGGGGVVSTCLASVTAHPQHDEMPFVDASTPDTDLLTLGVDNLFCNVTPSALVLSPLRGLPALGSYEIGPNAPIAHAMASEMSAGPAPEASPQWVTAHGSVTGVEVLLYVGAETRASSPVYAVSP